MPTRVETVRFQCDRPARARGRAGFSLIEVAVVIAIVGALVLVAVPSMTRWFGDQRVKSSARAAGDLLLLARSEAIRTGNPHVVFFGVDPDGTSMTDANGGFAPLKAVNDGPTATANCRLDGGEETESISAADGISWGVTDATAKVASDSGAATLPPDPSSGSSFRDPNGADRIDWVMFRPDGIPVVFDGDGGDCGNVGAVGAGGGALYITNGRRDYAIVLSPLGAVRVHVWQPDSNNWSS